MKVNTALCFVAAGISLRLLAHTRTSLKARIVNGLTIAITAIALLTICQYVLGWNLGIDELIFSERVSSATSHPGRMGVNTAVNFGLTGAALWLLNRQERQPPRPQRVRVDTIAIAQSLALIVGAIALQAVVGYAYNVRMFYQFSSLTTSMALHTALGFVVLAVGMLALRSDRGWMRSLTADLLGGDIARRFIPTAIVLPVVVGWLILQGVNAKLYDPNFALSLMSMSLVAISLGLIAKNAGIINCIDYDRIRSSEERLKLALQGARQGTWDFDLQTQELVWDDRCKEMFGLAPATGVNYDSYLAAVYPDDRQRVADAVEIAIRDCGEFAQEYRTIHSDGKSHWILTQGRYLCDPAGELCRMSGTMMEIAERKQVQLNERFLYELTRRLRLISDADEQQDEAARSVGEYLRVDRATWFRVDWSKRLATVDRDWYQAGLESHVGVYAIADFLPPAMQVALFAGESVAIADVHTDPSLVPHLAAYQQLGLQAFANIPCFNENQWVATLHVHTEQVRNWREDEIALLQAVAAQIWPTIEQTRAVQALRAQEEQTRAAQATIRRQLGEIEAIYQAAPIGLCFVDTDLKYVRINERLAQINGASVAAHIGHTLREILPELADDVEQIYRQVIESGEPIVDLEVSGTNPAQPSVLRAWISSFYPQTDAENRTIGVNTVVQEITERKRQEAERELALAALRVSERKFSAIFNQTFELMGIVSLDGVLLEVNQAALDSIAAQESEIVGKHFWEAPWWHTEQLQHQLRDAIVTAASGQFIRYEVEFPNSSGGVSSTDFSLKPIFDEAHRVVTILAEARDITEQQAALRERK